MRRYLYAISREDLEGPIGGVIAKLTVMASKYGEDAQIEIELEDDSDTFGSRQVIAVSLKGNKEVTE